MVSLRLSGGQRYLYKRTGFCDPRHEGVGEWNG